MIIQEVKVFIVIHTTLSNRLNTVFNLYKKKKDGVNTRGTPCKWLHRVAELSSKEKWCRRGD